MNTESKTEATQPRLPDIQLIVPPEGQTESLTKALSDNDQLPVLAWRQAAGTLHLLTDTALNEALNKWLEQGQKVTVWHGSEATDAYDLRLRLGRHWSALCQHLHWARIRGETPETPNVDWKSFALRLNRPDDSDIRFLLAHNGEQLPEWCLPDALIKQGQEALQAWFDMNLRPRMDVWQENSSEDTEALIPESDLQWEDTCLDNDTPFDWPWQDSPQWEAKAWMAELLISHVAPDDAPANEPRYRLHAAAFMARRTEPQHYEAVLHHVYQYNQWDTQQLTKKERRKGSDGPATTHEIVKVRITKPADGGAADGYGVYISLPEYLDGLERTWCLWLHLDGELPLPLQFTPLPGRREHLAVWPLNDERYKPNQDLWEAIVAGGVSLNML